MKKAIITIIIAMFIGSTSVNAAPVPRESLPCNAIEGHMLPKYTLC